jgi:5-methylcytosine-specific restriction endonuclease McrA
MPRVRTCKLCARPRVKGGYCLDHQACVREEPRQDNLAWRSTKGQKVRAAYLAENPYCQDCSTMFGRPVPAKEVHHLVPQIDRPDLVFEWDNLIALCHACHNNRHGKGIGVAKS